MSQGKERTAGTAVVDVEGGGNPVLARPESITTTSGSSTGGTARRGYISARRHGIARLINRRVQVTEWGLTTLVASGQREGLQRDFSVYSKEQRRVERVGVVRSAETADATRSRLYVTWWLQRHRPVGRASASAGRRHAEFVPVTM